MQDLLLSLDTITNQNIFLYKLQFKGPFVIDAALKKIAKSFQIEGQEDIGLADAIKSMKYIDERVGPFVRDFIFVGDEL